MARLGIISSTGRGKLPEDLTAKVNHLNEQFIAVDEAVKNNALTDDQRKALADQIFAEKQAEIDKLVADQAAMSKDLRNLSNDVTDNLDAVKGEFMFVKEVVQDKLVELGILTAPQA